MNTLKVALPDHNYDIDITEYVLVQATQYLHKFLNKNVVIITNDTVEKIITYKIKSSLETSGFHVLQVVIQDGEKYKNLETVNYIFTKMLENAVDRQCSIIAVGGGVVGDISGFVASTYMRGLPFIQIPTTLLAQVDSSVGGKTGVNHTLAKNIIGAFWQPDYVLIDINTLKTLPKRELSAGVAEVIKYGCILDLKFFTYLENNIEKLLDLDTEVLLHVIYRSCELKAKVVMEDEKEQGIRAVLNFGHTFGHAIEAFGNYTEILHGEAVAIGIVMAAFMSVKINAITHEELMRIVRILQKCDLPVTPPSGMRVDDFVQKMLNDKKKHSGSLHFITLKELGAADIYPLDVNDDLLIEVLSANYLGITQGVYSK